MLVEVLRSLKKWLAHFPICVTPTYSFILSKSFIKIFFAFRKKSFQLNDDSQLNNNITDEIEAGECLKRVDCNHATSVHYTANN